MKIGIMSDSHYDLDAIDNAICLADDVDCWLHAGDSIEDSKYLEKVSGKKVYGVIGNVDWTYEKPNDLLLKLADINIFLTHGHTYNVKTSLEELKDMAR